MLSTGIYLLKVSAYLAAFYIPFVFVLKSTTFFTINRVYLLSGLLMSFLLPLAVLSVPVSPYIPPDLPSVEPLIMQTQTVTALSGKPTGAISISSLIASLYIAGIGVRLVVLVLSTRGILKLTSRAGLLPYPGIRVYRAEIPAPFTFFHLVFLPGGATDPGIIRHEATHVRQFHWIDLVIAELASVVLWFNPVVFAYKQSLKQQHEYLADRAAVEDGIGLENYLNSIGQQVSLAATGSLTSGFYFKSIKNRIDMLTKQRTPAYRLGCYGIALPLLILVLTAFSPQQHNLTLLPESMDSVQDKPALGLPIEKNKFSVTSGFGQRLHPVLGVRRMHTGIDLRAEEGVPVMSALDGVVVQAELMGDWGNKIVIQHEGAYTTSYSHLKSMAVKAGDHINKGQQIGQVGHTGISKQDHLHFELLESGKPIDPAAYLPNE